MIKRASLLAGLWLASLFVLLAFCSPALRTPEAGPAITGISLSVPTFTIPVIPVTLQQRAREAKSQFAFVRVDSIGGKSAGSGVLVKRDGRLFVWTCAHVILDDPAAVYNPKTVTVKVVIGRFYYPAVVLACGRDATNDVDVALLEVLGPPQDTGSAVFDISVPEQGDAVYHLGAAGGMIDPPTFVTGIVSAPHGIFERAERDQLELPAYPGCSGGGVYSESGRCQGLAEITFTAALTYEVPARVIYRWAVNHQVAGAFPL